jgi:hypothetical protein
MPAKSRGYCAKHYRSDWGTCREPNCFKHMHNKKTGLCASHYARYRKAVKALREGTVELIVNDTKK